VKDYLSGSAAASSSVAPVPIVADPDGPARFAHSAYVFIEAPAINLGTALNKSAQQRLEAAVL
jgi:hypothetical protein